MTEEITGFGYDPTIGEPIPDSRPRYFAVLPPSFTVSSAFLPPVGQQGTTNDPGFPGSCAAWASTYGLATFTAAKAGLVDPSDLSGQASPAYIYIKVLEAAGQSSDSCGGSQFKPYFDRLGNGGTPSMAAANYFANCKQLWTDYGSSDIPSDSAFQIGPIASVNVINDLDGMKQVLASNCALAYGTKLYTDWGSYRGVPVPYVGNGIIIINKHTGKPAGHCMLIIGYDDTLGTSGSVLIQNSQGTGWGSNGFVWMAYATFQALAQGQAFYVGS